MSDTDLQKKDWEDCKQAAIHSIRNCKAQLIVYENQLRTAEEELTKFPVEENGNA